MRSAKWRAVNLEDQLQSSRNTKGSAAIAVQTSVIVHAELKKNGTISSATPARAGKILAALRAYMMYPVPSAPKTIESMSQAGSVSTPASVWAQLQVRYPAMLERKAGEEPTETVAPIEPGKRDAAPDDAQPLRGGTGMPAAEPTVGVVRRRLSWRGELLLATMPTAVVLGVMLFVEALSNQRILFASLASSAFLIYLDPHHATNRVRTLVLAQLMAAGAGFAAFVLLEKSAYASGAAAMIVTIALMVIFDLVHPPAIGTTLAFAFRAKDANNVTIFILAVFVTAALVAVQKGTSWLMLRLIRRSGG